METGGSSEPRKNNAIGTPNPAIVMQEGCSSDQYLPVTSVARIMRPALPPGSRIAEDSKETMQECISKFINLVTKEANKRCCAESRKILSADDLVSAMESLGFNDYIDPMTVYLDMYRARDPEPTRRRIGIPIGRSPVATSAEVEEVMMLPLFPVPPQRSGSFVGYRAAGGEGSSKEK